MARRKRDDRDGLYQREGSRYWWVRTDPITGKAESTGCVDREAARLWRARREQRNANPAHAAAEEATLDDWSGKYIELMAPKWSEATREIALTKLGHFARLWNEYDNAGELVTACHLGEIEPGKVDAYVTTRRGEGASDHTISKEVAALCRVLKLAKRGRCYAGDLDVIRPPSLTAGYVPRERALTREEVSALCSELDPPRVAFVAICVALGLRRSEAGNLLPDDIDLERGTAQVSGTKTRGSFRLIPILSVARGLVEAALPFLPLDVGPATNLAIKRACKRAEIEHCSPNDLRRTHASLLLEHGVDRDLIRRLLGHTTTKLVDTVYGRPRMAALGALAEKQLATVLPLALPPVRDSAEQKQGDPSGNRTRVTGVRGRNSCSVSEPDSAFCEGSGGSEPLATARRRWRRVPIASGLLQSLGYWAGRKARAA